MFQTVLDMFLRSRSHIHFHKNGKTRGCEEYWRLLRNKDLLKLNKWTIFLQTLYNLKWRHWPTFFHGLTWSTVAERRRSSQRWEDLAAQAPWREAPGHRARRSSHSHGVFTIRFQSEGRAHRGGPNLARVIAALFNWPVLLISPPLELTRTTGCHLPFLSLHHRGDPDIHSLGCWPWASATAPTELQQTEKQRLPEGYHQNKQLKPQSGRKMSNHCNHQVQWRKLILVNLYLQCVKTAQILSWLYFWYLFVHCTKRHWTVLFTCVYLI